MRVNLANVPESLHTIYGDGLLLNFQVTCPLLDLLISLCPMLAQVLFVTQVVQWFLRELYYIFAFRCLFVFIYYSVPLLVRPPFVVAAAHDTAIVVQATTVVGSLNIIEPSQLALLELLLVTCYTNPVTSRVYTEFRCLYVFGHRCWSPPTRAHTGSWGYVL